MIVGITSVYILGFLSWAVHSLNSNIGFIRIFDAQYIVAGLLPAASLVVFLASWKVVKFLVDAQEERFRLSMIFVVISFIVAIALSVYLAFQADSVQRIIDFMDAPEYGPDTGNLLAPAIFVYGALLAAAPLFICFTIAIVRAPHAGDAAHILSVFSALISIWLIGGAMVLYFFVVYPLLPPELGGAKPRCANLIVDEVKVPKSIIARFAAIPEEAVSPGLFALFGLREFSEERTRKVVLPTVYVLYNGEREIVFRHADGKRRGAVEIRRDALVGIVWCDAEARTRAGNWFRLTPRN